MVAVAPPSMARMTASRPAMAATGSPPPMLLARHTMSGFTPNRSVPPPYAITTPVLTSSKMSTIPWAVASSRTRSRKPGSGGTTPMLYWIGSTMMAAISPRWRSRMASSASALLNGATIVSASRERGMPAVAGTVFGASTGAHQGGRRHDADQDVVVVPVVAALELQDLVATGEAAGDPDAVHRDLGPRVAEAHEVHPEAALDLLRARPRSPPTGR